MQPVLSLETGLVLLRSAHYWRMCVSVFHNSLCYVSPLDPNHAPHFLQLKQEKEKQLQVIKVDVIDFFTNAVLNFLSNLIWVQRLNQHINEWHLMLLHHLDNPSLASTKVMQTLCSMLSYIFCIPICVSLLCCTFPRSFSRSCFRATERWPYSFDPHVSVFSPGWRCKSLHHSVSCILSQKPYIFLHNDCCNSFYQIRNETGRH